MRAVMEIIGIVLLINGIGGLLSDDFGLLGNVADGAALTAVQVAAIAAGAALTGGSLLGRKAEKSRRSQKERTDDTGLEELGDNLL